jgi:hypothetical protein
LEAGTTIRAGGFAFSLKLPFAEGPQGPPPSATASPHGGGL